jgi:hypothetical protein
VIYSHGLIVEGDDPRPVHPEYGVYDFRPSRAPCSSQASSI